ncbi:MAG: hypothetical protein R3B67_02270 [Phycisphaerales bacterium]
MQDDDVMMGHAYYEAMDEVISKSTASSPGSYMGLYVSDSWKKHKGKKSGTFMPIGFELFAIMATTSNPSTSSRSSANQKLQRGNPHMAAEEQNFFLRVQLPVHNGEAKVMISTQYSSFD